MLTLPRYQDFIRERLVAIGVSDVDIQAVQQAATAEVTARVIEMTGMYGGRIALETVAPETVDAAIEWHKTHRLSELVRSLVRLPERRETVYTRGIDAMRSLGRELDSWLPGGPDTPPGSSPSERGAAYQRDLLRHFLGGYMDGMRESAADIDATAMDEALRDHRSNPPVMLLGALWGIADDTIDSVDSAYLFSQSLLEIYREGIPPEVVAAARDLFERLQSGLTPEFLEELLPLANAAGREVGLSQGRSLVNEISLFYRVVPEGPLTRAMWSNLVMGRLLAPLIRAWMEILLAATPIGEGSMLFRFASAILRRMPDTHGLLNRIVPWLRRVQSLLRRTRRSGSGGGGSAGVGGRPLRGGAPGHGHGGGGASPGGGGAGTAAVPSTGSSGASVPPSSHGPGSGGAGIDPAPDAPAGAAGATPAPGAVGAAGAPASAPGRMRAGTGPAPVRLPHRRGRSYRRMTYETARTGGIREISGHVNPDYTVEVDVRGFIHDSLPSDRPDPVHGDLAPRFESLLPRSASQIEVNGVSLANYEAAHLWGPGFGDEARDGIMWAPRELNQRIQRLGVEWRIRELHAALAPHGGRVHVRAIARSHPLTEMRGTRIGELVLREVEYEVSVIAPEGGDPVPVFSALIQVDRPEAGGRVSFPPPTRLSGWQQFFSD